jgi:hypothetical protein
MSNKTSIILLLMSNKVQFVHGGNKCEKCDSHLQPTDLWASCTVCDVIFYDQYVMYNVIKLLVCTPCLIIYNFCYVSTAMYLKKRTTYNLEYWE